jgi:hypothetical protein
MFAGKAGAYPSEAPSPTNVRLGWKSLPRTKTLANYESEAPSPTNIRLGWKGLPRTNSLAYYKNL